VLDGFKQSIKRMSAYSRKETVKKDQLGIPAKNKRLDSLDLGFRQDHDSENGGDDSSKSVD
jgi:hypothetical protein